MNGSTAFHLKQIMSAEHLSLTQTAKQIGISPSSMRKVLKDATMSQPVMFKINRFIDDHAAIIATKPGDMPQAPAASVKDATPKAAEAKKPAEAKPATKQAVAKKQTPAKSEPKQANSRKDNAKPEAKQQPATKQAATKKQTPAKSEPKQANSRKDNAKPEAKQQPATKQAAAKKQTPAKSEPKQANSRKGNAKSEAKQQPATKQAAVKKQTPAKSEPKQTNSRKDNTKPAAVQTNLSLTETKPTGAKEQPKVAKPKRGFTIHQIDGEPIVPEAERQAAATAESTPTPNIVTDQLHAVEIRAAKLAQAGVGSMDPKPVSQSGAKQDTKPAAKPVPAKQDTKPAAKPEPAKQDTKPAAKPEPAKQDTKPAAKQDAKPVAKPEPNKQDTKPAAKPEPAKKDAKPVAKPEPAKQDTKPVAKPAPAKQDTKPVAKPEPTKQDTKPAAQTEVVAAAVPAVSPLDPVHKGAQTLQLFVDESFVHGNDYQRSMYIGITLVDQDDGKALDQFANTLYPFGWQPGDEVKARGKNHDQIAAMLTQAHGERAASFVVFSPQSDTGNFALGFGVLYPYLAAILRAINQLDHLPNKIRIALDRRNELEDEQLAVAARMLNAYVKAETGKDVMFMLRTSDSKSTIGIQYSDFAAHAALTFTREQLTDCGINRLPDLGSVVGDQITLFSMIGLQKYMLDDRSIIQQQASYQSPVLNVAERLLRLASKATNLTQVPDETLTQAKLVLNQLLQITPSAISGAINKMPFQTWYDMVARAAALLHYTDETLPEFDIDPDAMQIARDALNNIANLLASAR